jgi:hypothetical protein
MSYTLLFCPHCQKNVFAGHMLGLKSGLGPAVVQCAVCKQNFNSGRQEWAQMSMFRRIGYVIYSVVAAGFIGAIGALCIGGSGQIWTKGLAHMQEGTSGGRFFAAGAILGVTAVILLQIARVIWSVDRTSSMSTPVPMKFHFLSVHCNSQVLMLLIFFSIIGLSFLGGYLFGTGPGCLHS